MRRAALALLLATLLCLVAAKNDDKDDYRPSCPYPYPSGGRLCREETGFIPGTVVNGSAARIFYRLRGKASPSKPTLVFQHGVTGSSALFACQLEHFCQLGYQTLAIDMRGGGYSDKVGPWNHSVLATDLRLVTKALKVPVPFVGLGWSFGGPIMQTYYNLYPEDLLKLVLIDSTPSYVRTPEYPFAIDPNFLQFLIASIYNNSVLQAQIAINDRIISDPDRAATQELRQIAIEIALQSPRDTAVGQYSSFPTFNNLANLPNIRIPVLLMHGELDPIFNINVPLYMRGKIPNSFLQFFAGKGHSPFLTDAERFNRILGEWLDGSLYSYDVCKTVPSPIEA